MPRSARPKDVEETGNSEAENNPSHGNKKRTIRKKKGRTISSISKKLSEYQKKRIATETPEEREARLAKMRERARLKIASETAEEREARLSKLRSLANTRRVSESKEKKEARLADLRERAKEKRLADQQET